MWFKRIVTSVAAAVCLCTCLGVTASAESNTTHSLGGVSPLYDIADIANCDLTLIGEGGTVLQGYIVNVDN